MIELSIIIFENTGKRHRIYNSVSSSVFAAVILFLTRTAVVCFRCRQTFRQPLKFGHLAGYENISLWPFEFCLYIFYNFRS